MKRIVLCFSLILILLCFPKSVISQENRYVPDQDQAQEPAGGLEKLRDSSDYQSPDQTRADAAGFLNAAYDAWDDNNFDKAIKYFKKAQVIEPGNQEISDLIYDVEKDKIRYVAQKVAIAKEIIKQKRMLENDKAWLISQPETILSSSKVKALQPVTLKMQAASKIVSIDFNNAQLSKILEYLSKISKINIIMDEAALANSPQITISLNNVSLIQALESVLRTKGLSYRFENDFIWVSSKENIANEALTTRVYHLSQGLATFTAFTTFDTVTVDAVRGDNTVVVNKDENEYNNPGVSTYEGVKVGGPSGVAGNVTVTIENVLKQFVNWPEGSRIFLDKRTSTLIVRNTPSNMAILEDVIKALDVNPPQVMIEARFVEIGEADLFSLGVKMSGEISADGATSPTTYPFNKNQNTKYASAFPMPTTDQFAFGTLNFSQFQAVLSAIEQNTNTNTLSSPKITTISGQEAVIKIVKEYRYPTKYEVEVIRVENAGGETVTQSFPVPVEFKTRDIGIILRVTPNVGSNEKTINLTLVPEVSEFDIDEDMYNYGTDERPFLQPFFNTRNATASIIVNNNDTVVMGGLMREEVTKGIEKVPLLGHLPILGSFFSRKVDNKQKRNLLIFVTASIIAPTGETVDKTMDAL